MQKNSLALTKFPLALITLLILSTFTQKSNADDYLFDGDYMGSDSNANLVGSLDSGDSLTISGEIVYTWDNDYSITGEGNGISVILKDRGRIESDGSGINLEGHNNLIRISNQSSLVSEDDGVRMWGDNNAILIDSSTARYSITTRNDDGNVFGSHAILIKGKRNTITLTGSLRTLGSNSHGIFLDERQVNNIVQAGDNQTIISGSIRTEGTESFGMYSKGENNRTNISGAITTLGAESHGIYQDNNKNTTILLGSITTYGEDSNGIHTILGNENTITVSGSITTYGRSSDGIFTEGNENTITVSGSVTTWNDSSDAIDIEGSNNITIVTGNIMTYGEDSEAIYVTGENNIIHSSGALITKGDSADGIVIAPEEENNTVIISGLVASELARSIHIHEDATNNTIQLIPGARIVGPISSESEGNTLRLSVGAAKSYIFATEGPWILEDLDGRAVVQGSAMAAGIGNLETADEMQYGRLDRLNSALSRSNTLDASQAQSWAVPYVSTGKRKADALTPAVTHYDTKSMGVVAGKPTDWWGGKAGLLLQLDHNKLNIAGNDHVITSTSARMGLRVSDTDLSTQSSQSVIAMVGYNHYDSARSVLVNENTTTGETTFNAKFGSVEFLLGGAMGRTYDWSPKLKVHTQAQADVSYEMIDSYTESTYFSWKKRNLLQASARVAATVEREHQHNLHSLWGLAISHRNVLKGREGDYAINGTSVSFKGGDHKDTVATLSAGIKYNYQKDMTLRADVSTSFSANRVSNHSASVKVNWKF